MLLCISISTCPHEQHLFLKKKPSEKQPIFNQSNEAVRNPAYEEDLYASGKYESQKSKNLLSPVQS